MNVGSVVFDRYELHEQIGAGGMGTVWRATDQLLHQTVAIKHVCFLAPGAPDTEQVHHTRDRMLREARLAARLRGHPHVVAVYDVLVDRHDIWLVLEYLPSLSLRELLRTQHQLDLGRVARIGAQLADALAAGHAHGIEHRDVTPGNVLIGPDGLVKLTDYGISRLTNDPHLTQTGISGTPAYLAPEVAACGESSPASDVFSLGSTLYAAIEGQPPFGTDDNTLRLLNLVRTGIIRPPTQAGSLEPLLLRLLQVNPATRPDAATVRDLLTQLTGTRATEQPPTPPEPPTPANRAPRLTRRHAATAAGALLVLSASGVLITVSLSTDLPTGETPSSAAAVTPVADGPGPDSLTGALLTDSSFEKPRVPANTVVTLEAGQSFGAWTVTRGSIDHIGPGFWPAADGSQSVDLAGLADGAVAQTFNSIPGVTYVAQFSLTGNPDGPPGVKTGRAMVDGHSVKEFSFDTAGKSRADMNYQKISFSFTASGPQSTVEFTSTSGGFWGPVIDDVTVTMARPADTRRPGQG